MKAVLSPTRLVADGRRRSGRCQSDLALYCGKIRLSEKSERRPAPRRRPRPTISAVPPRRLKN